MTPLDPASLHALRVQVEAESGQAIALRALWDARDALDEAAGREP